MARILNKATDNFTKKDMINTRNALSLQDIPSGTELAITACATFTFTEDDENEGKLVTTFKNSENEYISTISAGIHDIADDIIDIINADGTCSVRVDKRTSKAGREFLTLVVL